MLMSKLIGERTKENPSDAMIASHALLVRAGFIKLVSNGIWSLATPAKRICQKIEKIIRDEMDAIGGQEASFPVVMPRELWEQSGRYTSIGSEMVRFKDRTGRDLVLGMTHEEAAVHFVRDAVNSYQQLPVMVYQFQTKFRDEARCRGGLIRVREFIMKDAYSFHIDNDDLEKYYAKVYDAYINIFNRMGMKRVVAVKSDTGMMGGSVAHEYMLLTDVGEDAIVICPKCDYKANMEVAVSNRISKRDEISEEIKEVYTAEATDIAAVAKRLGVSESKTMKAVCYCVKGSEELVLCFIRGDLEINEAKLKRAVQKDIAPANLNASQELQAGNIGAYNLNVTNTIILFDKSLENQNNLVTGANKAEYHLTGIDMARDFKDIEFVDIAKVAKGEMCPICNAPLDVENGIEVGNIFQLGTKYTESMNMTVLGSDGKPFHPIMGCYGIGIGRALASVAQESHDKDGLIWPMAIAPWQVYLCGIRMDNSEVYQKANELYAQMIKNGIEVIFDDRDTSPGVKFSDCDLMGIPIRVVVSPRSLANGEVEIQLRDKTLKENYKCEDAIGKLKEIMGK
ncbi:MAG: proline--tRNA ligase [Clostridiales bacterium]|nr:proline--tRNA ligase [Clostridiales bacterium]